MNELASKSSSYARVCMIAWLIVGLVALSFVVRPVWAAPLTINAYPSSAPVGDALTFSGVNATPGGEVRLYVVDYLYFASTVANESGGYSVDVAVPAIPLDTYSIMALDTASGDTASTVFGVEPRVLLTQSEGGYSDQVSVKGDGFYSYSQVTFTFDGTDVSPSPLPQTDPMGSFSASFSVPSRSNGTYEFTAEDEFSGTASTPFNVFPKLILWPTSGASSILGYVQGYGFAANVNATVFFGSFNITPYPWMTTWFDGSWEAPFFVPVVSDGFYTITGTDDTGLSATAMFVVPSPVLTLSPERTSDSSVVTASGVGFQPNGPIVLYLEGIAMTSLVDLMWMSPSLRAQNDGSFEYSFIVPVTNPGDYTVGAYMLTGPLPAQPIKLAEASLVIVDDSPLMVAVNVGPLHFRGEMAEFYVETSFGGQPVDAAIGNAKLYWNGTLKQDLTGSVGHVAEGLFKIPYSVPSDAAVGTYNLVVEVSYTTTVVEAFGTSSGSFLLSAGFTDQNARLIDVQGKIGTILVPDLGIIKANLTTINAKLVSIDGKQATIQSDIGTLTVDADTINAKVTSIDGNVATISSDLGTIKSQITNPLADYTEPATLILSLVAAIGAMTSLLYVRKIKHPKGATLPLKPPETPPSATTVEEAPEKTETQETQETPKTVEKPEQATMEESETPTPEAPATPPTPETQPPPEAAPEAPTAQPITETPPPP